MRSYLRQYKWANSLTECGPPGEVGTGMICRFKEQIYEAYKNGVADGKKIAKVQTQRDISIRRIRR